MLENEDFLKILEHSFATSQETAHTLQERNNSEFDKVESLHADLTTRQETSLKQFDECAKKKKHLSVEIKEKQQMIDALTSDNEELKNLCNDQTLFNSKLRDEIYAAINHQKEVLATTEINHKQSTEEISRAQKVIDFCSKYLGLEIVVLKEKRLQFLFKNIIQEKSDAVAYINLSLNDQNNYSILETNPPLSELKKLEDTLNRTNNLSGFIHCTRRLLKNEWLKSI